MIFAEISFVAKVSVAAVFVFVWVRDAASADDVERRLGKRAARIRIPLSPEKKISPKNSNAQYLF